MRNSTKSAIRRACLQTIDNPDSKPRERLQAAAILEKLLRARELRRARQEKKGHYKKRVTADTVEQIDAILSQVAN